MEVRKNGGDIMQYTDKDIAEMKKDKSVKTRMFPRQNKIKVETRFGTIILERDNNSHTKYCWNEVDRY